MTSGGFGTYATGIMWCPGISALITMWILKRDVKELGWGWGKTSYQIWSFTTPVLYALIAYVIIWVFGWGGIQDVFTPLTRDTGNTNYYIDEFGIVLPVVCVGFALYFWSRRNELNYVANNTR